MTASLAAMPSVCQTLLYPRSIALVGASDDVKKTGGRPLQFLRRSGFADDLSDQSQPGTGAGRAGLAQPGGLPQVPDHVFVLSPTETVIDTVRECARLGVSLVTILASGFSESGAEGVQREAELRAIARTSTLRILGPSSLGWSIRTTVWC
jgi:acyl-CoA synthetase (NDP forming)